MLESQKLYVIGDGNHERLPNPKQDSRPSSEEEKH
jgi:hypothetical protein